MIFAVRPPDNHLERLSQASQFRQDLGFPADSAHFQSNAARISPLGADY